MEAADRVICADGISGPLCAGIIRYFSQRKPFAIRVLEAQALFAEDVFLF